MVIKKQLSVQFKIASACYGDTMPNKPHADISVGIDFDDTHPNLMFNAKTEPHISSFGAMNQIYTIMINLG